MYSELSNLKRLLRVEHSEDDDLIVFLAEAAEAALSNYLSRPLEEVLTSERKLVPALAAAVGAHVAAMYRDSEAAGERGSTIRALNFSHLIDHYRKLC